ncbi:hypothetical protein F3Y22_tig00117016pilonHSYRG00560 [Hibiscus syriacus]|uniref:Uncharacterized protein n=1 Tax=Hibiscus syriacus TaxID=106335 RepID=A0A6A2WES9_HIBSY|nr:hypothetical protein F3Y22_tig00117016pilonHSYRG00560 [Hibiscus syriacus]
MKYVLVHPHRVGYEHNFYNEFCLSALRVDRVEHGFISYIFKVPPCLILIKPAETFGDIVIDYLFCYFEQFFNMANSVSIAEELALCCHFLLGMDPGASASVMQDSFTYKKEMQKCSYEEVDQKAKALLLLKMHLLLMNDLADGLLERL